LGLRTFRPAGARPMLDLIFIYGMGAEPPVGRILLPSLRSALMIAARAQPRRAFISRRAPKVPAVTAGGSHNRSTKLAMSC
jgi:hypothetical protein